MGIHVRPPRVSRLLTDAELDAELARPEPRFTAPTWRRFVPRCIRRPGYALHFTARRCGDGPAMKAAHAAFADHARRWVQGRCDTLNRLGRTDAPCREHGLDLRIETTPRRSLGGLS